jgi:hypothetical protein
MPTPVLRALTLVLCLALAAAACSDDEGSSPPPTPTITIPEGDPHLTGALRHLVDEGSYASSGTVTRPDERSYEFAGQFQVPATTYVLETAVVPLEGEPVPIEVRTIEGAAYVERATVTEIPEIEPTFMESAFALDDEPWAEVPRELLVGLGYWLRPVNLTGVLMGAARLGATLEPIEDEPADPAGATGYRVVAATFNDPQMAAYSDIKVWLDADDVVQRASWRFTTDSVELTVDGYGEPVEVEEPPADETGTWAEPREAEPTEDLAVVAEGTSGDVDWTLSVAPGTHSSRCWELATEPDLSELRDEPWCLGTGEASPADSIIVLASPDLDGDDTLAMLVPAATAAATIGFRDGEQDPVRLVPVDDQYQIAVWSGTSDPLPGSLRVVLTDGSAIDCAPGTILDFEDLMETSEDEIEIALRQGWSCVDAS